MQDLRNSFKFDYEHFYQCQIITNMTNSKFVDMHIFL